MLNHQERMRLCIAGDKVDRSPVALWRHFPVDDNHPETLASSIIKFQELYDFDFVKITPSSSYCVKDWGAVDRWEGNPEGSKKFIDFPVKNPKDWLKLQEKSPNSKSLSEALRCIKIVRNGLPATTPVIQTIFSPLSQAKNLVGKDNLVTHLHLYPEEVKHALDVITKTTINFVTTCVNENIDGIFYAIQHAQAGLLSPDEYQFFASKNDLEILDAAKSLWLNVAHIHGSDIYFDQIAKFPVQVLNWHDQETSPSLAKGKSSFQGAVCGGLRQWETLVNGNPEDVTIEAKKAIHETNGLRFILGTGCVLPITAPHTNILAVRNSVEK